MNTTFKRLLSFAVALVMVLGLIPVTQLEAKAAETNTVTATTAYWGKNSSGNWQIFESSKAVDLNKVNEKLVPVGEVAADGTMTAYCEVCGTNRTWKAITDSAMPILREAAHDNSHYYLKESITATNGNAPSTDSNLEEGSDFKQSYFWLWIMNRNTCLHLNGFDLTLNVSYNRGYIYHNQHMLNIMGEGTITGNGNSATLNRGAAITANCNDATNFSIVNLFGGTYKSSTDLPAVAAPGTSSRIDIYPGATVEGLSAAKGKINVRGGTVTGKVDVAEGTLNVQSGTVNMTDGAITKPVTVSGGKLNMSGGSITAASTQTVLVSSGEFNLSGGTVNGRIYASSLWNQSKLAYVPGVVNMTGGTINGLGTKEAPFAITSYGGGAMFAANGGILNISGGTVNGGWLPDATNSYASAIYITAAGATTTVGENTYKTGVTQLNISGDAVIRGQGYYDENGNVLPEEQQKKVGMTGTIQLYGVHWNNAALWPAGDGAKLTMTGGTIYGGYSSNGAAIQAAPGVVEITGGTIYGGKAANAGGTMQLSGYNTAAAPENSYAIIKNATIIGGTAGSDGGSLAIYSTNTVIENSTIDGGISTKTDDTGYSGGGNMYVSGQSVVTVKNSEIKNGKAINGGNITFAGRVLNLEEGTEITGGEATGWLGGGALNASGETCVVNVNGAYIHDNTSYRDEENKVGAKKQVCIYWGADMNMNSGVVADQSEDNISVYLSGYQKSETANAISNLTMNGGELGTQFYPDAYSEVVINDGKLYGPRNSISKPENTFVKHGQFAYSVADLLTEGVEQIEVENTYFVHTRGEQADHKDNSCTEDGYTSFKCATCEAVYTPVTTQATDHDYKTTYQNDGETHTVIVTCQNDAEDVTTTAGQAHVYENGVCICGAAEPVETNEAVVGGVKYETLEAALAAAAEVEGAVTVQLLKDTELEGHLVIGSDITLDLNGKVLTAAEGAYILAYTVDSYITDTSADNSGRLVVDMAHLRLLSDNSQLPVKMADGIMFVDVTPVTAKTATVGKYQSWVGSADAALIAALAENTASELNLEFQMLITWGANELEYTFSDATVSEYAANWETLAMFLQINGAEKIEDLKCQARIVFADDSKAEVVVWSADQM